MTDVSRPRGPMPPAGTPAVRRITGETARPTPASELSQAAAGVKALDAFFGAHLKEKTPAARGLMELLAGGALSPATGDKLAGLGLRPRDLLSVAYALEPHLGELGLVGEGLARTGMDLLVAADSFAELVEGPQTRQITAEVLPRYLAEAVGRGQPAAVAQGALEVLQGGFVSPATFAQLGATGLGHLALLLEAKRPELADGLDPAGRNLLAQGAEGLGRAAMAEPGSYQDLAQGFLANVPGETRPFWSRQVSEFAGREGGTFVGPDGVGATGRAGAGFRDATHGAGAFQGDVLGVPTRAQGEANLVTEGFAGAEGTVRAGLDGLEAHGRVGAAGKVHGDARGRADFDGGLAKGHVQGQAAFDAEGFAGAEGRAHLGPDGLEATGRVGVGGKFHGEATAEAVAETPFSSHDARVHGTVDGEVFAGAEGRVHAGAEGIHFQGRAGAEASVEAKVQAETNHEILGGLAGVGAHGEASVRATAAAQVKVEGHVGFDQKGNVEAYAGFDAKAVAEIEAEARGQASINILGFKFTGGGYAKAQAGVGVEASGGAGYKDGKFFAKASAGVTAKVGQEQGGFAMVELPDWAKGLVNMMAKTEAGRSAIGMVGQAVNPIFGALGQAFAGMAKPAAGAPRPQLA